MRSTAVVSFLVAAWALASHSPAAFATPVPSQADLAGAKRGCNMGGCRIAEPPVIDTTSESEVESLVNVLINALQTFEAQDTSSNATV